jgi:hypothetical protein
VSARIPPLPPPAAASNPIAGTPRKELPSAAPAIWREQATRSRGAGWRVPPPAAVSLLEPRGFFSGDEEEECVYGADTSRVGLSFGFIVRRAAVCPNHQKIRERNILLYELCTVCISMLLV